MDSSSTMPLPSAIPPVLKMGPCGEPCDSPCDDHDHSSGNASGDGPVKEPQSAIYRSLKAGLVNAIDLCFDHVYEEPKRILMVGGCRQISLAQHIALMLPAVEITLVDADEAIVAATKEAICCRFKFVTTPLEKLPYPEGHFDLTIAHHFHAYPQDWKQALSEISRVTSKSMMISVPKTWQWKLSKLMGTNCQEALVVLGAAENSSCPSLPSQFDWLTQLTLYAKIKSRYSPFPWSFQMCQLNAMREERLILN
jgi:SAM-dependent methyltransferase